MFTIASLLTSGCIYTKSSSVTGLCSDGAVRGGSHVITRTHCVCCVGVRWPTLVIDTDCSDQKVEPGSTSSPTALTTAADRPHGGGVTVKMNRNCSVFFTVLDLV